HRPRRPLPRPRRRPADDLPHEPPPRPRVALAARDHALDRRDRSAPRLLVAVGVPPRLPARARDRALFVPRRRGAKDVRCARARTSTWVTEGPMRISGILKDKLATVFGAGGSVGSAVAEEMAAEGAEVFLAGRTRAKVEEVAARIRAAGGRAHAAAVDALDDAAADHFLGGRAGQSGRT